MASPNGNLDEVHETCCCRLCAAWLSKGTHARIDDVVAFLQSAKDSEDMPTLRPSAAAWTR
jgi:conjugal transfer ATP-binding protein TraC